MRNRTTALSHGFAPLAWALAASFLVLAAVAAHAASPQSRAESDVRDTYSTYVPGATKEWCESLAYPYCSGPALGAAGTRGNPPYVLTQPPRPIFGE